MDELVFVYFGLVLIVQALSSRPNRIMVVSFFFPLHFLDKENMTYLGYKLGTPWALLVIWLHMRLCVPI
jgi:hypothetical protein